MTSAGSQDNPFWDFVNGKKAILAALAHLTAFLAFLPVPFLNLAAAAVCWLGLGAKQELVRENAKEAFAFQVSLCVPYYLLCKVFYPFGHRSELPATFLFAAFVGILLMWSAFAALRAYNGDVYKYALSLLRLPWQEYNKTLGRINRETEARMEAEQNLGVSNKFPALQIIAVVLTVISIIVLIVGGGALFFALVSATDTSRNYGLPPVEILLPFAIGALISGVLILAAGEIIKVFLAIEKNTRITATKMVGTQPTVPFSQLQEIHCGNCGKKYSAELKGQYCESCGSMIA